MSTTPNRGPLQSLSVVPHGPIGISGNVRTSDDPNERPANGTKYFGIHLPLNIGPEVGKALDERKYGHRGHHDDRL